MLDLCNAHQQLNLRVRAPQGGWLARLQADARRLDEESAVKEATAAGDGAAQKEFSNRF